MVCSSDNIQLADGATLHVQVDTGPAGAPWLVLSNSVLTNFGIWDHQTAALAERFSVLRYDQRGHGQSSISVGPMTFEDYGADVLALLDHLDIARCVYVGLSMGVPTGLAAMSSAPGRFQAFVAVDGVAKSAPGREAFWSEKRETARQHGLGDLGLDTAYRWLPGESAASENVSLLARMVAATPVEGFAAATHALQSYDCSAVTSSIACPFLAISGSDDGVMPDAMRRQFSDIKNARFEVIESAGHVPNFQRPQAFNKVLLAFLEALT
ncbi:alpha/beta fold hydrolase [Roseibium algae]|uniref:Alpha/beta fold hydrolase n=1 Tax=Roseibium algae TaxID=3123038 RepID=A0ABU8TKU3_9HYPH